MQEIAYCVHALTPPSDDATLAARRSALRAFGFSRLIDKGRIEYTHARGYDFSIRLGGFEHTPTAGRDSEIDTEDTHGYAPPDACPQLKIDY
jgi:hypothetical protein